MRTSKDGIDFIKAHEGFRATPYKDVAGYLTIGFGHLIKKGEVFGAISSVEATAIMQRDLSPFEDCINSHVHVNLQQCQFDALVSFTYNLGQGNFVSSTLLKKLNANDMDGAADEFLKWDRAGGQVVRGIFLRRQEEQVMFLGG